MATTPNAPLAQLIAAATPGASVDATVQPTVTVTAYTCADGTVRATCPTAGSSAGSPAVNVASDSLIGGLSIVSIGVIAGVGVAALIGCVWYCRRRMARGAEDVDRMRKQMSRESGAEIEQEMSGLPASVSSKPTGGKVSGVHRI
jgi:hypothetical protein